MMDTTRSVYPLFFTFRQLVTGNGFVAGVTAQGRALMAQEDDDAWWIYGVQPGGMAATGCTANEVYLAFSSEFKTILFDIAESCSTFEEFDREVRSFFSELSNQDDQAWTEARNIIRSGAAIGEPSVATLPREMQADPTRIDVERLDRKPALQAQDNMVESYATAA